MLAFAAALGVDRFGILLLYILSCAMLVLELVA